MIKGTRRRGALLALTLVGLSLVVANRPGEAQTAIETGWWWKGNPPGLSAPPNVGTGLMVAALPDGATALAAVRAPVDAQSLTMKPVENGDVGGVNAHLIACAIAGGWVPRAGGRWDDKPVVACDLSNGGGSVAGIRAQDGSWAFPLAPLVVDGGIDVAIVPAAGQVPGGLLEPFQLVFRMPTLESFVVNPSAPAVDAEVDESTYAPADNASDQQFTSELDGFNAESIVGDGSFAPVASAALPPAEQAPRVIAPVAVRTSSGSSSAQGVAVLLLVLLAGAIWLVTQQALPAPVSLTRIGARTRTGPAAPPAVGGLGRFERTRSGRPPSLF